MTRVLLCNKMPVLFSMKGFFFFFFVQLTFEESSFIIIFWRCEFQSSAMVEDSVKTVWQHHCCVGE